MQKEPFFERKRSDIYSGLLFVLERFEPLQRQTLKQEGLKLIDYFNNTERFDCRYEAFYILDEIENLILAGVLSNSEWSDDVFLKDSVHVAKELMEQINVSIDTNNTQDLLTINFKFIYIIVISLYILHDIPELINSRLGELLNIYSKWDAEELLKYLTGLLTSLGLCLIYLHKLDKKNLIKLERDISLKVPTVCYVLNDTALTLDQAFGYKIDFSVLPKIQYSPEEFFSQFTSGGGVLEQIMFNANSMFNDEASTDESAKEDFDSNTTEYIYGTENPNTAFYEFAPEHPESNQSYESDYIYQKYQTYNQAQSETISTSEQLQQNYNIYKGLELIEQNLKTLGISYLINNKATWKNSLSVLNNIKNVIKITNIFQQIAECGGNLEAYVSKYSQFGGLNLEFIKNGSNHFMSARTSGKNRLCVSQGNNGEIVILSFGTHYNNFKI
jgi:hypothetical protein